MLNPFFLQGSTGEQGLIQDLVNEQIRMYGIEIYYIPRKYVNIKTIIREVTESKFDSAFPIEAYVSSYDGYSGQGTILSKFGIQDLDDLTLVVSKERFENYITPLLKNLSGIDVYHRPKEGDLVYFPLGDRLFEIKYVEHETPFYQLQKNYVYELKCELFRYGDEILDTEIDEIDDNVEKEGYIQTYKLVGIGRTATAYSSIGDGSVSYITVTNRGINYENSPAVTISKSPINGGNAVGVATLITGIVDYCDPLGTGYRIQGVELQNGGYGYMSAPMVNFIGGGGVGAEATATIADGVVNAITLSDGGFGYDYPPSVTIIDINEESFNYTSDRSSITSDNTNVTSDVDAGPIIREAQARAIVENQTITSIRIIDGGEGYLYPPIIQISSPNLIGIGTFISNETITGSESNTTAKVAGWNAETFELKLKHLNGEFKNGEQIIGSESQSTYKILTINTNNIDDPYAQNDQIQLEALSILDFTEENPFGTP
jgi:hypothetical protein